VKIDFYNQGFSANKSAYFVLSIDNNKVSFKLIKQKRESKVSSWYNNPNLYNVIGENTRIFKAVDTDSISNFQPMLFRYFPFYSFISAKGKSVKSKNDRIVMQIDVDSKTIKLNIGYSSDFFTLKAIEDFDPSTMKNSPNLSVIGEFKKSDINKVMSILNKVKSGTKSYFGFATVETEYGEEISYFIHQTPYSMASYTVNPNYGKPEKIKVTQEKGALEKLIQVISKTEENIRLAVSKNEFFVVLSSDKAIPIFTFRESQHPQVDVTWETEFHPSSDDFVALSIACGKNVRPKELKVKIKSTKRKNKGRSVPFNPKSTRGEDLGSTKVSGFTTTDYLTLTIQGRKQIISFRLHEIYDWKSETEKNVHSETSGTYILKPELLSVASNLVREISVTPKHIKLYKTYVEIGRGMYKFEGNSIGGCSCLQAGPFFFLSAPPSKKPENSPLTSA